MTIGSIIFILLLIAAGGLFAKKAMEIRSNILLGKDIDRNDNKSERINTMLRVAFGQSKMVVRPIAGVLHLMVYIGFIIINLEVLEIVIDGIFRTHRIFKSLFFYDVLISSFEVLAFLVIFACVVFLIRRNIIKIKRFHSKEMVSWPKSDANIILVVEILLMSAFLIMNATDSILQSREVYSKAGSFPVSGMIAPLFSGMSSDSLIFIERFTWWFHIVGILIFLNYLPYSKHLHIILAFPNTYYSNLNPKGKFNNIESVTNEVKMMFDPEADPYAAPPAAEEGQQPERFGAKDVEDLTWKQLLDSYTCTECGRCTSVCPANQTGKLLSPRKIMMDTRDRLVEKGEHVRKNGVGSDDGKSLLRDYISEEELWACTTCNACTEACPVNIDPVSIIMEMRRYLVMEESKMPSELTPMLSNIENNGAPWQFSPTDRLNWKDEQ
jgi:heterodisulfide reductase subunit C